jgi:serine/threonine protein kinase
MIGKLLLNRYELLEKIGEGGMGVVYKAKCHLLNRFVTVKILKAELSNDEDFLARFKREATSVAKLSHQNIVNVYDVGSENQINFIVMEYIDGKTLKQIIKENVRLSYCNTIEIALQIARALDCAHKNKIIHRDIKPDNILITEDNTVKVTDFGIAKAADTETITSSNKVTGSAHYFSPEQAKGSLVDCRTDIYSLGIVMYEMITGRVPFNADSTITLAMKHIQEPVIPPKEIIADLPENINKVILKAVEKEPFRRYQTAKEMAEVLNKIKENIDYKVNLNNRSNDSTEVMEPVKVPLTRNDLTMIMSKVKGFEKPIIEKGRKSAPGNKSHGKKKKIPIFIGSIIIVMIIGVSGKNLPKVPSTDTISMVAKTTVTKVIEKLPASEKKVVHSLKGVLKKVQSKL